MRDNYNQPQMKSLLTLVSEVNEIRTKRYYCKSDSPQWPNRMV